MSQQTILTAFFAIATPKQIARNNEREWAMLRNDKKPQQAFNKVSASMCAEKTAENRHKNDAKQAQEYRAQHRAAKKGSHKQVGRFCMHLQLLTMLYTDSTQATYPSLCTSSPLAHCHGYPTQEGHQEAACIWNSTNLCQSTCKVLLIALEP